MNIQTIVILILGVITICALLAIQSKSQKIKELESNMNTVNLIHNVNNENTKNENKTEEPNNATIDYNHRTIILMLREIKESRTWTNFLLTVIILEIGVIITFIIGFSNDIEKFSNLLSNLFR